MARISQLAAVIAGLLLFCGNVSAATIDQATAQCRQDFAGRVQSGLRQSSESENFMRACLERSSSESNDYDPGADKGFELTETHFITKLNRDQFVKQLRIKVKIASRELADDGKREVLEYDFGGCPRGVGSVDRYNKNVLSFTITAEHDCFHVHGPHVLLIVYAAVLNLGAAKNTKEAIHSVAQIFDSGNINSADTEVMRSSSATAHGKTIQIIGPPGNAGLIFKIYPTISEPQQQNVVETVSEDEKTPEIDANDFGITEAEFVDQYNTNVGTKGARIKVLVRERAPDGLRDVVTYGFGRLCVRGLSSTERKTKRVLSLTIVPYAKNCPREFSPDSVSVLAVAAMVMRVLADVTDLNQTMGALVDLGKELEEAPTADTTFGGRKIVLANVRGVLLFKIFPH